MKNTDKISLFRSITVRDVLSYLDGKIVAYKVCKRNLDSIDSQYCSKKIHFQKFNASEHDYLCLSNKKYLYMDKSFIDQYIEKGDKYSIQPTSTFMTKASKKDVAIKKIFDRFSGVLMFHVIGGDDTYINIRRIVSAQPEYCSVNKAYQIRSKTDEITKLERELSKLKREVSKLNRRQEIYNDLYGNEN